MPPDVDPVHLPSLTLLTTLYRVNYKSNVEHSLLLTSEQYERVDILHISQGTCKFNISKSSQEDFQNFLISNTQSINNYCFPSHF
jgi:hypothetical protein